MELEIQKQPQGKPFLIMQAENEAEEFQLNGLKGQLIWANVSFSEVEEMKKSGKFTGNRLALRFNLSE